MDFTIIGAGNMGRGIATRLLDGGNSVVIVDRDNEEAEKLVAELRSAFEGGATVSAATMDDPIQSEAVVLAVYYPSVPEVLSHYGDQLAGKIIVDITNPLNETFDDLATPPGTSAAEEIAKMAPPVQRSLKLSIRPSPGHSWPGRLRINLWTYSSPEMMREQKIGWQKRSGQGACARSMPVPCAAPASSKGLVCFTLPCKGNWGPIGKVRLRSCLKEEVAFNGCVRHSRLLYSNPTYARLRGSLPPAKGRPAARLSS